MNTHDILTKELKKLKRFYYQKRYHKNMYGGKAKALKVDRQLTVFTKAVLLAIDDMSDELNPEHKILPHFQEMLEKRKMGKKIKFS